LHQCKANQLTLAILGDNEALSEDATAIEKWMKSNKEGAFFYFQPWQQG